MTLVEITFGDPLGSEEQELPEDEVTDEATAIIKALQEHLNTSAEFNQELENAGLNKINYWKEKKHDDKDKRNPTIHLTVGGNQYRINYDNTEEAKMLVVERWSPVGDYDVLAPEEDISLRVKKKTKSLVNFGSSQILYHSHTAMDYNRFIRGNTPTAVKKTKDFLKNASLVA